MTRTHVKYGLGYTKALNTWAVGDPPTENPKRYLDHPQLGHLLAAVFMLVFGIHEWTIRLINILTSIGILLLFLRILRGLVDPKTVLLAGFFYVLFPLTGYFSLGGWSVLFSFLAFYFYLVIIGALSDGPQPKLFHKIGLALSIFLGLQVTWTVFFVAFGIGLHYVCHCIKRKKFPARNLLLILIIAPFSSLLITFTIMAWGYGWDISKIIELFKWRAAKGEMQQMVGFDWGLWFAKLGEFANTNFTLPILIIAVAYITFGQLFVFTESETNKTQTRRPRQFPQFCLFFVPTVTQLLVLRGALWRHQSWLMPLGPLVAIAAAQGVLVIADILKKIHPLPAVVSTIIFLGTSLGFCMVGTDYYYGIRWQPEAKIKMFKMLNELIPPDKALLSFEPFIVNQHESKGAFYREIVPAQTMQVVEKQAMTGRFPYYLVPQVQKLMPLIDQLAKKYKYQYVPGKAGETKNGKFYRAGMMPYLIFNL
ncbi:MAG: ArnT family glycosyltransferase [Planctomycetota bacterium]|jgi:4-amino-4-deoxy-L-arabinose transferase-like glycosyltransferase